MGGSGVLQPPPVAMSSFFHHRCPSLPLVCLPFSSSIIDGRRPGKRHISWGLVFINKEDNPATSTSLPTQEKTEGGGGDDPDPQDLEYVSQIKTVLEHLRRNRDMLFNEGKSGLNGLHIAANPRLVSSILLNPVYTFSFLSSEPTYLPSSNVFSVEISTGLWIVNGLHIAKLKLVCGCKMENFKIKGAQAPISPFERCKVPSTQIVMDVLGTRNDHILWTSLYSMTGEVYFGLQVKLTVMIEDPRDVERRRLLGIDDENAPTRDDLAAALVQINEGQIPEDRVALQMLAEEMLQWPNLEVEAPKKNQPGKSLYAKFTDTGIDPKEAAKRLNIDWDTAAEIEDTEIDDVEVPPAVGYGALYLVTAFPVIIGISVVLILFYNSLQ